MLRQELIIACIVQCASFCNCCNAGPGYQCLSQEVVFLGTAIWFFSSLVIVLACHRAMQRVTVILKRLELYLNNECVFANASLY